MNAWKLVTIVLIFIMLFEISLINSKEDVLGLNGLKIPQNQLQSLGNAVPENSFVLCDIENNKCIQLSKAIN